MGSSILIVEDNDSIREPVATLLRLRGFEVVEAENGREAFEQLQTKPLPGLILLDLMMPVMDGWTFLDRKSKEPDLAHLPVIIVSAVASLHPPKRHPAIVATTNKLVDMPGLLRLVEKHGKGIRPQAAAG